MAPGMKQGRSSSRVAEPTNVAEAQSGLGLGERTEGAAGNEAVASTGSVGVGVDRVVRGILFYFSIRIWCPPLLTRLCKPKRRVIVSGHSTLEINYVSDGKHCSMICAK